MDSYLPTPPPPPSDKINLNYAITLKLYSLHLLPENQQQEEKSQNLLLMESPFKFNDKRVKSNEFLNVLNSIQ